MFKEYLKQLCRTKNDNQFQKVMTYVTNAFLKGLIMLEEFNAICHVASVLNPISYQIYVKQKGNGTAKRKFGGIR